MRRALTLVGVTFVACQPPPAPLCGWPVGPGESMAYSFMYADVDVGQATVTIASGPDGGWLVHASGTVDIAGLYSAAIDEVDFMTTEGAAWSEETITENGHTRTERDRFDEEAGRVFVTKASGDGPPDERDYPLTPGSHVALTALYSLRARPPEVGGAARTLPVFTGKETRTLVVSASGHTTLETAFGERPVLRLNVSGQLSDRVRTADDPQLYLSEDSSRVPVRLKTIVFPGFAELDAVGCSGAAP